MPFLLAGLAAIFLAVPAAWWLASAPAAPDPYARLGAEIGCQCGTCPNRPIATCGCGFADRMLEQLRDEVAEGRSDEVILASFEDSYGPAIRIKPAASGVDLAAWLVPMMLLLGGAVGVSAVLAHWREQTGTSGPASGGATAPTRPSSGPSGSADREPDGPTAGPAPGAGDPAGSSRPGGEPDAGPDAAEADEADDRYRAIVDRELGDLTD